MSREQLDRGTLALVNKMTALGLGDLAVKELALLKKRWVPNGKTVERQTIASLLDVKTRDNDDCDMHISYLSTALRVLGAIRRPAAVEAAPMSLSMDNPESLPSLILKRYRRTNDATSAAQQLETFSRALLSLCPQTSSSADAVACNPKEHPSATVVFQLQVLAFQARVRWWIIARHKGQPDKEIWEPVTRCAAAFARRASVDIQGQYSLMLNAVHTIEEELEAVKNNALPAPILKLLANISSQSGNFQDAVVWTTKLQSSLPQAQSSAAPLAACDVKLAALAMELTFGSSLITNDAKSRIKAVQKWLDSNLGGTASDQDALLSEFMGLRKVVTKSLLRLAKCETPEKEADNDALDFCYQALGLCCRYLVRYVGVAAAPSMETKHLMRFSEKAGLALRVLAGLLDSLSIGIKSSILSDTPQWEDIDSLLKQCQFVMQQIPEDESIQKCVIKVSAIYWDWYLKRRKATTGAADNTLLALRRSVEALQDQPSQLKTFASYAAKLERLARELMMAKHYQDASPMLVKLAMFAVENGVLEHVATRAATSSLKEAWECDKMVASLARTLTEIHRMASRLGNDSGWSSLLDTVFDRQHRVALLELRLHLISQDFFEGSGSSCMLIETLARELFELLDQGVYPLRRVRALTKLLQITAQRPDLQAEILKQPDISNIRLSDDLGQDLGLETFKDHIITSFDLASAFASSSVPVQSVKACLHSWQIILDSQNPCSRVDDSEAWVQQLRLVCDFLNSRGEGHLRIAALNLLVQALELSTGEPAASHQLVAAQCQLANQYVRLGYSGRALSRLNGVGRVLDGCEQTADVDWASVIWRLASSEYYSLVGDSEQSSDNLRIAESIGERIFERKIKPPANAAKRLEKEMVVADAFRVSSLHALQTGQLDTAISFAKQSTRLYQRIWASLENNTAGRLKSASQAKPDPKNDSITARMGKLSLHSGVPLTEMIPTRSITHAALNGPMFWDLSAQLFRAQMHLSDVFTSLGLWQESVYHAEQACKIANATEARRLSINGYTRLASLYMRSGRLDEAADELGKADMLRDEATKDLTAINLQQEKLRLKVLLGDGAGIADEHEAIMDMLDRMMSDPFVSRLDRMENNELPALVQEASKLSLLPRRQNKGAKPRGAKSAVKSTSKGSTTGATTKTIAKQASISERQTACDSVPLISTRNDLIRDHGAYLLAKEDVARGRKLLEDVALISERPEAIIRHALVQHLCAFKGFLADVSQDLTYNAILESSMSFPSIAQRGRKTSDISSSSLAIDSPIARSTSAKVSTRKTSGTKQGKAIQADFKATLRSARDYAVQAHEMSLRSKSYHLVSSAARAVTQSSLLLSTASSATTDAKPASPLVLAGQVELANNHGCALERAAVYSDLNKNELPHWPSLSAPNNQDLSMINANTFQTDCIDALPEGWTAISLTLNEQRDELYLVRYESSQTPFILRLPLARHNSRDVDEDVFGFDEGKAELKEIITQSDMTTHGGRDMSAKGAKAKWWEEREALDGRLRDLLQNIENIWIGGFKGILAQQPRQPEQLQKFQKAMEKILDKHLPSRRAKKRTNSWIFDPGILELFTGLGYLTDMTDEQSSLDEELLDLLYFVVDILQFNGERNAYDEIDFDSIAVEVIDALKLYHDSFTAAETAKPPHTILVLDKALHAFPWESMPCLKARSVSRMPSMEALKERLALLTQCPHNCVARPAGYYASTDSGTSILNPSGDLKSTQTALAPLIDQLPASWTRYVGPAAPLDENCMTDAIENSDVLLYVGHGSTAQYVRPRTVRKLCAVTAPTERTKPPSRSTALLMGCSSAAVTENGDFQPHGMVMAYLAAGSPAVVGCLWDVTDRDCDRLSVECGRRWGLWDSKQKSEESSKVVKGAKKGKSVAYLEEEAESSREPHKSRPTKCGVRGKMVADSGAGNMFQAREAMSLTEAVAASRDACYLKYLNGAAVVVYGIPVYLHQV